MCQRMRPTATSTPTPTLIKRNQRYAGNQIAVAATIAAATASAAVPRIGIVIGVGYAGLGLILTSLNPKTHVAGASAIGFVHGLSPESVREPTRCWKMLEVTGTRVWTTAVACGVRFPLHPGFAAAALLRGNVRRRGCANLGGQLALNPERDRRRCKTGPGKKETRPKRVF